MGAPRRAVTPIYPLHLNGAVPADLAVYEAANLCISDVMAVPASILW